MTCATISESSQLCAHAVEEAERSLGYDDDVKLVVQFSNMLHSG